SATAEPEGDAQLTLIRADAELRWLDARVGPLLQLLPRPARDLPINLRLRAVGVGGDDRPAFVGCGADIHVQRHAAEERHAELLRLVLGAAVTENVGALPALRA